MTFTEKLQRAITSSNSLLSIGLDPDPIKIPKPLKNQFPETEELVYEFCRRVIESTKICAGIYKINLGFFEALGSAGWTIVEQLLEEIPHGKVTIADAKRGDIGTTAEKYREAFFGHLQVDALTLNPLMGLDTIDPFMNDEERAVFILTLTSNRGSADFLQQRFLGRMSLAEYIAEELNKKQALSKTHLGMVVGATQPRASEPVLMAHPDAHLLIPGVGTQGGDVVQLNDTLKNHLGIPIIHSSRAIIYAGADDENWEERITNKAIEMQQSIQPITDRYVKK